MSEFELITAVAFYYFSIQKVDYVVLEVGLGGLYDATNIIKNSTSIITTIDFDHTERLGLTLEEIALQKAGIIKQNSKVALSSEINGFKVIEKIAKEKNTKILELPKVEVIFKDKNYAIVNGEKYEFNLLGSHQAKNLALVLGAIKDLNIKKDVIKRALKKVTWRFRLEYNKEKNILIDAGHNPAGIKTLRNFLDENFKNQKKTFIFGCLKNKEYEKMLDILIKKEDEFYFYEFDYPNALGFEQLPEKYNAKKLENLEEIKNIPNLKIFCGSIYMLGKIFSSPALNSYYEN